MGSRIVAALQDVYELITPSHSDLDITSKDAVENFIASTRADAILHLAAISDTGYCEEHPQESYMVNVVSVENIAMAAASHGIKLIWFSSDQVYNGCTEPGLLSEDTVVSPENHYGRHKLLAEKRALEICPDSVALRATWMYDSERPGMKTQMSCATSRTHLIFQAEYIISVPRTISILMRPPSSTLPPF